MGAIPLEHHRLETGVYMNSGGIDPTMATSNGLLSSQHVIPQTAFLLGPEHTAANL